MVCVVYRWRWAILVQLVALILLSVKGEIVLGFELGSLIIGDQKSMVEQWLQALLDTPPRVNIAAHEP